MNQQLMVRLVPRHTLQMRFFLILAQPLKTHFQKNMADQSFLKSISSTTF